jgi:hypothetical protein
MRARVDPRGSQLAYSGPEFNLVLQRANDHSVTIGTL